MLFFSKVVTIQYNAENERKPPYCNYSAVPQMQGRGLQSVLPAQEQADDTARWGAYVVDPIIFPGGDIGELAVNETTNYKTALPEL